MKQIGSGQKVLGLVLMILGIVVFVGILSPVLIYVFGVFLALWLINYGMKLRGMPPLIVVARSWWYTLKNFR